MTPRLTERLARLEQEQRVVEDDQRPMPPTLYEQAFRAAAEVFGDYPSGDADTLGDGLARALGYADRAAADVGTETDPEIFSSRIGALWPRLVERYAGPLQDPTFRTWCGILDGSRHYRSDGRPTADLRHLPNGLPLFDYTTASVKAAFAFFKITADEVEATHHERHRH